MIDADIHIFEPASMWEKYLDKEFRDKVRVEHFTEEPGWRESVYDVWIDGYAIPGTVFPNRKERLERVLVKFKSMFEPGFGTDPDQYVKDLDTMGIEKCVIYPSYFLWAPWIQHLDARFAAALARAYNDWLYDFCGKDRKRLYPVCTIALHNVDEAIKEVKRCSERGFVAAWIRPNPLFGRTAGHPDYHPLYEVMQDLDMTLGLHEGGMTAIPTMGTDRTRVQWGIHAMSHPFEIMSSVISFLEFKVWDKFPKLRTLFNEAGSSLWVPYWLDRLDEELEMTYRVPGAPKLLPSEYWARQCFATFEAEDHFLKAAVDLIGDKTLMMTSDYPHPETSFKTTGARMLKKGLSQESLNRVVYENAKVCYPRIK